jgi:hypothetical protein
MFTRRSQTFSAAMMQSASVSTVRLSRTERWAVMWGAVVAMGDGDDG